MGNGFYVSRPGTEKTGVAILRVSAVRSMHLNLNDVRFVPDSLSKQAMRYQLRDGDLLFTRLNGNPEFVGACAMVRNSLGPVVFSDKFIRIQVDRSKSDPEFLELALAVGISRQAIRARSKTTAGQASIAGSDLRSVPIPVPLLSKQREIADLAHRHVTSLDGLLKELPRVDAWAQRLRTSVLSAAFTGRLAMASAGPQTQFMPQVQLVSTTAGVDD
jgi:type I restriction enzyme S subunit